MREAVSPDADGHVAKARRDRSVADVRDLERLALVARRDAIQSEAGPVGDRVAARPELGTDTAEGAILEQSPEPAALDFPADLTAKAKRQPPVVDAHAAIQVHEHPVA